MQYLHHFQIATYQSPGKFMKKIYQAVFVSFMAVIVAGCSIFPPTLVEQGVVTFDIRQSEPVRITSATAYREDGEIVIRGTAAFPTLRSYGVFSGHVDMEIAMPNGERIFRNNVPVNRKRIPKVRGRKAYFVTRVKFDPPKGTVVYLTYHHGPHLNGSKK